MSIWKKYQDGGKTFYNQKRADELGYKKDSTGHLPSVDNTTGIFLKSKQHPTVNKEVEWYNSNDPSAVEFRKKNNLDVSGEYMRYIPKPILEMTSQMQKMAFNPITENNNSIGQKILNNAIQDASIVGGSKIIDKAANVGARGLRALKVYSPALRVLSGPAGIGLSLLDLTGQFDKVQHNENKKYVTNPLSVRSTTDVKSPVIKK